MRRYGAAEVVGMCQGSDATFLVVYNPDYFEAPCGGDPALVTVRVGAASHQRPSERYFQERPLDPLTQAHRAYAQYDWNRLATQID